MAGCAWCGVVRRRVERRENLMWTERWGEMDMAIGSKVKARPAGERRVPREGETDEGQASPMSAQR